MKSSFWIAYKFLHSTMITSEDKKKIWFTFHLPYMVNVLDDIYRNVSNLTFCSHIAAVWRSSIQCFIFCNWTISLVTKNDCIKIFKTLFLTPSESDKDDSEELSEFCSSPTPESSDWPKLSNFDSAASSSSLNKNFKNIFKSFF